MLAVVKIGTSSITAPSGEIDEDALRKLCKELVSARGAGNDVLLVCSGAIAAGMPALGFDRRPADIETLPAIAAVGQPRLMERLGAPPAGHDVVAGGAAGAALRLPAPPPHTPPAPPPHHPP